MAKKNKQWATSGITIGELFEGNYIGKKLVPIKNNYAYAMPQKVFKVKQLKEESYEILKISTYTKDNFIISLQGADDKYSMIGEADCITGMNIK